MNEAQWFWAQVLATIKDVNNATMPLKCAKLFFLLWDLCGGADGRAWQACTWSGISCTIKFSKGDSLEGQRAQLEAQAQVWHMVWKVNGVCVTILVGQPALLMPYAHTIKDPSDKDKQDMQNAIKEMALCGYCHEDLTWCHVGRLGLKEHLKQVILFYLVRVSQVETDLESVEAAEAKMSTPSNNLWTFEMRGPVIFKSHFDLSNCHCVTSIPVFIISSIE
jgi:hypothetical protein